MNDPASVAFAQRGVAAIVYALLAASLGHWLGGGAALGRLDAALFVPTLPLAAASLLLPRRFQPQSGAAAVLLPTALLLGLSSAALGASQPAQWSQLAVLGLSSALLLIALRPIRGAIARRHAGISGAIMVAIAAAWWLAAHVALGAAYTGRWQPQTGKTIVLTGLPLRTWPTGALAGEGFNDSAALVALRRRVARPLILADGLAAGALGPNDRLLLAHPRALPPETLVEIDRFVRAGGRAVILADGLSGWPPSHPFGDARNPPVTSLLTPLLDHWGLRLDAPLPGSAAEAEIVVRHRGWRLMLHSTGHFSQLPRHCRGAGAMSAGQPTTAICRIGRGTAVVLADADMLFDPLWRPEPLWAAHLRRSDNIEWLATQLNQPQHADRWGLRPTWR